MSWPDRFPHCTRFAQAAFGSEVNWLARQSYRGARRIHEASLKKKRAPGLIVAGGLDVAQFKEKRRPTQADLVAAAPETIRLHQLGYDWIVMYLLVQA